MRNRGHPREEGFALVTGLLFLLITTLLAVTTMARSNLQTHMSSTYREHSRAQEASEDTLRHGEGFIAEFSRYQPPQQEFTSKEGTAWWLFAQGQPWVSDDVAGFRKLSAWAPAEKEGGAQPQVNTSFGDESLAAQPEFYVEEMDRFQARDLNPDTAARAEGMAMYRVTARSSGGTESATAILQSHYMKRY